MQATTELPITYLDVLTWTANGRVRSTAPTDTAPVRLHRPGTTSRCITAKVLPVAAANLIVRVENDTEWQPTPAGNAWLNEQAGAGRGAR